MGHVFPLLCLARHKRGCASSYGGRYFLKFSLFTFVYRPLKYLCKSTAKNLISSHSGGVEMSEQRNK